MKWVKRRKGKGRST